VTAALRGTFRLIVDVALPQLCPACRTPVDGAGLCAACWSKLSFIAPPYCERLGIPFHVEGLAGRLLLPILFRIVFHRLLTVRTPLGRRARGRIDKLGDDRYLRIGDFLAERQRHSAAERTCQRADGNSTCGSQCRNRDQQAQGDS
jgi:hypothetical protein